MKKLLLSSVMMLFLCAVSFAQTEKQSPKMKARTEAYKQAQEVQNARNQEKLLALENAKNINTNSTLKAEVLVVDKAPATTTGKKR